MTVGAIILPLLALVVCGGGAWLAWRLVRAAEIGEGEDSSADGGDSASEPSDAAPVEDEDSRHAQAERSGVHLTGFVIATAAILIGLGGIGYVLAGALGIDTMWLLVAYALVLVIVVGATLAVWRRNRARRPGTGE